MRHLFQIKTTIMETKQNDGIEIISTPIDVNVVESTERAMIDQQIATAKKYPRNIHRVRDNVVAIVSLDEMTARSCAYALPRDGKTISGASVHLARIVAQQYGNIRIDARITDIGRTHVTGQATCVDLENNIGIRVEVKRRITDKRGNRYSDDMITMTGNAASAIALRNAVFAVIPKPLIDAAYIAARQTIIGDVSDENKLVAKRQKTIDEFIKSFGVTESDILRVLNLRSTTQIKAEQIVELVGIWQSLRDGDTTVDEVFGAQPTTKQIAQEKTNDAIVDSVNSMLEKKSRRMTPNINVETNNTTSNELPL